jgi:hypothetical protein
MKSLGEYQVKGKDGIGHWIWMKDNFYMGPRLLASESQ